MYVCVCLWFLFQTKPHLTLTLCQRHWTADLPSLQSGLCKRPWAKLNKLFVCCCRCCCVCACVCVSVCVCVCVWFLFQTKPHLTLTLCQRPWTAALPSLQSGLCQRPWGLIITHTHYKRSYLRLCVVSIPNQTPPYPNPMPKALNGSFAQLTEWVMQKALGQA
jgi:hypothetical protein